MSAVNIEFNEDHTHCYVSIKDLNMMYTLNNNPDLFSEFNKRVNEKICFTVYKPGVKDYLSAMIYDIFLDLVKGWHKKTIYGIE